MISSLKILLVIGLLFSSLSVVFAIEPLHKVERLHSFSHPNELDTFRLSFHSLEREDFITFDIISSKGELLFHEKFYVWGLNDYFHPTYNYQLMKGWKKEKYYKNHQDSIHVTDSLKRAEKPYLLGRINQFLDDKHFSYNPVPEMLRQSPDLLIKGSYEEFLNDPTTIGFTFRLADEYIRGIAYSKKKKKVVVYFTCC